MEVTFRSLTDTMPLCTSKGIIPEQKTEQALSQSVSQVHDKKSFRQVGRVWLAHPPLDIVGS